MTPNEGMFCVWTDFDFGLPILHKILIQEYDSSVV